MAMAGLWESWKSLDGEIVRTVCIVTIGANELMAPIHDRMPVLVAPQHWQSWLAAPADEIRPLVVPYPANEMRAWPVSRRVSRTTDDDSGLIEPASDAVP
jgi:putative SOS response-associated peptidase YedK